MCVCIYIYIYIGFPDGSDSEESALNVGDPGSTSSLRRFPEFPREGNGNSFQYSCLENYMDRGAWQATVHESQRVLPY